MWKILEMCEQCAKNISIVKGKLWEIFTIVMCKVVPFFSLEARKLIKILKNSKLPFLLNLVFFLSNCENIYVGNDCRIILRTNKKTSIQVSINGLPHMHTDNSFQYIKIFSWFHGAVYSAFSFRTENSIFKSPVIKQRKCRSQIYSRWNFYLKKIVLLFTDVEQKSS